MATVAPGASEPWRAMGDGANRKLPMVRAADAIARLCNASGPPPRAMALTPAGRLTATGTSRLVVVPSPSCECEFRPQARTPPVEVRARLCALPAATAVTAGEPCSITATGVVLSPHEAGPPKTPLPSWPPLLLPHDSTPPDEVSPRP